MMDLFDKQTGFRLKRLEVYNWGTFDGQIWTMTPDCETAVLTGANGSGKSTLVDALLTLLVEGRQRNYNLASGAGSSRERSERTYVRGQYSRSRGENTIDAKPNTLRGLDTYSVLLAVFYDAAQDRTVSLAQVLWISNVDRVEKRYYVATCDLSIEQHFPQRHITARDLPVEAQTFGSVFKDYIAVARKALGLSGRAKALDLFNETVAVKDIASLNTFVRDHMLNKGDPEARVDALRTQYRELNDAHAAIQRASRQLEILTPLVKAGKEYRRYQDQIVRYEMAKTLVPFHVADKARELLRKTVTSAHSQREAQYSRRRAVDDELAGLRRDFRDVEIAIAQDSAGQMKREIEGKLPLIQKQIDSLRRNAERYDEAARLLELAVYQHEEAFYDNRLRAQEMLQVTDQAIRRLETTRRDVQIEQRDLAERERELDREVRYLRENLSNIPARVARIRQEICAVLKVPAEDLPFAGELLRVRDGEQRWEGVLERLLHSFAQDLIVPDALYHHVSQYVNDHNLKGRLIYHRVDTAHSIRHLPDHHNQVVMAYDKLQIKQDTPYYDWLAAVLMQKFAYVCCESLADFRQEERAITPQGQIKHSASRHEKDDRRDLHDRRHYVLGWNNHEKLHELESELDELRRRLNMLEEQLIKATGDMERKQRDIRALENLLEYQSFEDIDWRTPQAEHDGLKRRLAELSQQTQQLQQLQKQHSTLERQIKDAETRRDEINRRITTLDNQIAGYEQNLRAAEELLASATDEHKRLWDEVGKVIVSIDEEPLTIEKINSRVSELEVFIQRSIANFKGYQNRFEAEILHAMNNFRREYPDAGASLTADINALAAFEGIFQRLETDDLPRYAERFKQMLDRTVTRGVQVFYSHLSEQEREIDRSIEELNESLAKVDYGSGSIIQLIAERNPDPEINDFMRQLRACIPDAGDASLEERERAYNRIKALIERFDSDPGWMRRVIDVRRWRVFAAEQIDRQGRQVDYYNDSSGKSGGQKAKLAYTILASAIAYQYGLQDPGAGKLSFRFVVIDEAFSKLDEDNARFAMQLFKQLGLQLLVVTPMQQLHVIEDYVRAYHVVVNNDEGSCSRLFNLTQSEYRERRREFQAQRA